MMNKTDQLIDTLRARFRTTYSSKYADADRVDALVLGYFKGFLGVLEASDPKLVDSLEFHIKDNFTYTQEQ